MKKKRIVVFSIIGGALLLCTALLALLFFHPEKPTQTNARLCFMGSRGGVFYYTDELLTYPCSASSILKLPEHRQIAMPALTESFALYSENEGLICHSTHRGKLLLCSDLSHLAFTNKRWLLVSNFSFLNLSASPAPSGQGRRAYGETEGERFYSISLVIALILSLPPSKLRFATSLDRGRLFYILICHSRLPRQREAYCILRYLLPPQGEAWCRQFLIFAAYLK